MAAGLYGAGLRGLTIHSSRSRFAARLNSGVSPQKAMDARSLELLALHGDLLPPDKRSVARWLCESWAVEPSPVPSWLRQKYWRSFPFSLHSADAPERMLRDLVLELLSQHKQQVLARGRADG